MKQVESIDILIRTSENNLSIEDNAIKKYLLITILLKIKLHQFGILT